MASSQGLTQRKRNAFADADSEAGLAPSDSPSAASGADSATGGGGVTTRRDRNVAMDPSERFEDDDEKGKDGEKAKLTLLEEVLLLGIKDVQVREKTDAFRVSDETHTHFLLPIPAPARAPLQGYLSFWNDNISYVLRGCILMELSIRNRIQITKDSRRRPLSERTVEVINETPTGEVLLDEALKLIKLERQSVGNWIDLLSGEPRSARERGSTSSSCRSRDASFLPFPFFANQRSRVTLLSLRSCSLTVQAKHGTS